MLLAVFNSHKNDPFAQKKNSSRANIYQFLHFVNANFLVFTLLKDVI